MDDLGKVKTLAVIFFTMKNITFTKKVFLKIPKTFMNLKHYLKLDIAYTTFLDEFFCGNFLLKLFIIQCIKIDGQIIA